MMENPFEPSAFPVENAEKLSPSAVWLFVILAAVQPAAASSFGSFNRDVRPVMSENCFACHGPDANARKAGLRLDTKEGLFEKTPKRGPAVVPGKPEQSELWRDRKSVV